MGRRNSSTILVILSTMFCGVYFIKYFSGDNIYEKQTSDSKLIMDRPADVNVSTFNKGVSSRCSKDDFAPSTVTVYDLSRKPNNSYDCPNIRISEKTIRPKICLYPSDNDVYVSKTIREQGAYEGDFVDLYVDKLRQNPDMSVIDVGANIGMYTLVAASMGRQVLAVEPMPPHASHLHASVAINNFRSKVTLLHNAISDCRGEVIMRLSQNTNQGAARINGDIADKGDPIPTYSIMLSDIIPYINFTRAYMKIDIEGFEHRALVRLPDLLRRVEIPIIQMEWKQLQLYYSQDKLSEDLILTEQFVQQLLFLGYDPYDRNGHKMDITRRAGWTTDTMLWMTKKFAATVNSKIPPADSVTS